MSVAAAPTDEEKLLEALHGQGVIGKQLRDTKAGGAAFKLEVHFGKDRSAAPQTPSVGVITIWESGRRFHGGGDEKMYWCGFSAGGGYTGDDVCGKPIKTELFAANHVVCPSCRRENFLDPVVKQQHIEDAKIRGQDVEGLKRMPIVGGEKIFKMTPKNLSNLLARLWRDLGGNADVYMKYHASDIRCRDVPEVQKPDVYSKAREVRNDGLLIYPLERIVKDTIAGADLEKRFLAMITA